MIEWSKVAEGWAGYGVSILVLIILLLLAWIMGLVIQRVQAKNKKTPAKETPAKKEG